MTKGGNLSVITGYNVITGNGKKWKPLGYLFFVSVIANPEQEVTEKHKTQNTKYQGITYQAPKVRQYRQTGVAGNIAGTKEDTRRIHRAHQKKKKKHVKPRANSLQEHSSLVTYTKPDKATYHIIKLRRDAAGQPSY